MAVITGSGGELRFNGTKVAKCRDFSIEISRDALETTTLGDDDRNYTAGLRGATGSATVLYDPADSGTTGLLNNVLDNTAANTTRTVAFVLNTAANKTLSVTAILTQVSTPVSVGEVVACSVSFQVTGSITGAF